MNDLETSELRSNVIKKLTESSITPTRQRVDIGQCLFVKDQHITAEQLREQVNKTFAEVSKATVYNTLGLFAAEGLLREVIVDPSKHVYDTNVDKHHHLYHIDTGRLQDIDPAEIILSGLPDLDEGVEIEDVDIVIRVRNTKHNNKAP
jgi:Fur family iron response transcriptional regulator